MARDTFESVGGGVLRDQFGRREMMVKAKHAPLVVGDEPECGTTLDADGREQIVLVNPDGTPFTGGGGGGGGISLDDVDRRLVGHVGPIQVNGHSGALGGGVQLPRFTWAQILASLLGTSVEQRGRGGAIMCWPNSGTGAGGDGGYASVLQAIDPRRIHGPYHDTPGLPFVWGGLNDLPSLGLANFRPCLESLRTQINAHRAVAKWLDGDSNVASVGTWGVTTTTTNRNSGTVLTQTQTSGDTKTFVFPADWDGRDLVVNLAVDALFAGSVAFSIPGEPAISAFPIVAGTVTQPNSEVASKHNVVGRRFAAAASCAGKTLTCTITRTAGAIGVDSFTAQGSKPVLVPGSWRPFSYAIWAGYPHGGAMNDASVLASNVLLSAMCAEWADGLVKYVEIDDIPNKQQSSFDEDDGVHLNEDIQTLVAVRFYETIRALGITWLAAQKLAGAGSETIDFAYRSGISPNVYLGKFPWDDVWPGDVVIANSIAEAQTTGDVASIVRSLPGQTGDMQQWRYADGTVVGHIDAIGVAYFFDVQVAAPGISPVGDAALAATPATDVIIPIVARGHSATHAVALQEWRTFAGVTLAKVDNFGSGFFLTGQFGNVPAVNTVLAATAGNDGLIPIIARGHSATHGVALQEWQSNLGTYLARITQLGAVHSISDIVANDGLASQVTIGSFFGTPGLTLLDAAIFRTAAGEVTTNKVIMGANAIGQVPTISKAFSAGQTADLYQAQSSSATVAYIDKSGNVGTFAIGAGFRTKEGTNAKQGVSTLVAGTVAVGNTSVTANSRILLTVQSLGTVAAPKAIGVTARTPGSSFTITSADATDTSVVAWEIFEPG